MGRIDVSTGLHLELPPGVDITAPALSRETHEVLARVEGSG